MFLVVNNDTVYYTTVLQVWIQFSFSKIGY